MIDITKMSFTDCVPFYTLTMYENVFLPSHSYQYVIKLKDFGKSDTLNKGMPLFNLRLSYEEA